MSEPNDAPARPSGYVMTLEAHRARVDEMRAAHATDLAALRATATGLLDELIAWFGAPDWIGPQLPLPLARRIAEFLEAGDAGVAAGPQATPDQVLWEGETTEAERISGWSYVADNEGQQRRDWGRCSLLVQVPGGTRVRVVAVPTDPTTVRVAEVRRPIPGARDMTGDAVPTDHEDRD